MNIHENSPIYELQEYNAIGQKKVSFLILALISFSNQCQFRQQLVHRITSQLCTRKKHPS